MSDQSVPDLSAFLATIEAAKTRGGGGGYRMDHLLDEIEDPKFREALIQALEDSSLSHRDIFDALIRANVSDPPSESSISRYRKNVLGVVRSKSRR